MKIVVGYDGSESARRAIDAAAVVAGADGRVAIAHVAQTLEDEERQEQLLLDARQQIARSGVSAVTLRLRGEPARMLVEDAGEIGADLLLVGSRGRGSVAAAVLGSVSRAVAATAPCPVLVVPPNARLDGGCVIAALDGSDAAGAALVAARRLADHRGLPLLIAYALAPRLVPAASTVSGAQQEFDRVEEARGREVLELAAQEHGLPPDAVRLARGGADVAAMTALAEREEAWVVAVGSRGLGAVGAAALGSFSATLAARGPCPVLVVRPDAGP